MDRVAADNMGMLATIINAIAMQDAIEKRGVAMPRDERRLYEPGG